MYKVFGLSGAQRDGLIRRAHNALSDALRQRRYATVHPTDLNHLLGVYRLLHNRTLPAANHSTTRRPAAKTPEARATITTPLVHALRTVLAHAHAKGCQLCKPLIDQAQQQVAATADLIKCNERLRREVDIARAGAHRLEVQCNTLIAERDAAQWKLRNAHLAMRQAGGQR